MKQFEMPDIVFDFFAVTDILSVSDPTDETGGGEITTPEDEFPDE